MFKYGNTLQNLLKNQITIISKLVMEEHGGLHLEKVGIIYDPVLINN